MSDDRIYELVCNYADLKKKVDKLENYVSLLLLVKLFDSKKVIKDVDKRKVLEEIYYEN